MSKHSPISWFKKLIVGVAIAALFFQSVPVYAVVPVIPVTEVTLPAQKLELTLRESLMTGLMGSLLNASSFFVRKIAHDMAVALASAGNGQTPLFITNPKQYAEEVAAGTIGSAVDELGDPFGLNLCQMPDVNLRVFLQIGIRSIYGTDESPTPGCGWQSFQQIENAWGPEQFERLYGPESGKFSDIKFNDIVSVRNSDFGIAMGAVAKIDQLQAAANAAAKLEQQINTNIKDITSRISGQVVTPAEQLREDIKLSGVKYQVDYSNSQIAGIYAAELPTLLPTAANVFLSTFASTLLNRLLDPNQGIAPPNPGSYSDDFYSFGSVLSQKEVAERAFSFLLTSPVSEQDLYNILAEFSSCPQSPGLNNCVIDQGLANAIQQAENSGRPLTIREALDRGYLHENWPLISPRRVADNTNVKDCYRQAYCYSNIQKLRKARILPLGFEIAALKALPDQRSITLGEVVANFNNCDPSGLPSASFPFCRLINPEWIIKAPTTRCEMYAVGPQLVDASSALRRRECLDVSTCVVENPDGTCANVYGFCTKEKNVWRFGAESCSAQYSTCTTFQGNNGTASYLRRTLDTKYCNENTVGCQAYSLNLTDVNADTWQSSAEVDLALKRQGIDNQVIHFNDAIQGETCSPDDEGCHAFYGGIRDVKSGNFISNSDRVYAIDFSEPIYIQRAPNYLGCYDTNRSAGSPEINWPVTEADLSLVNQTSACANYSRVCVESEVGCDSFTRVDDPDAPAIPGIVGGNVCPLACVGYDAFREQPTLFTPTSSIQYFIPDSIASGGRCSLAQVGCSEFTNIDEAARGGEALEYYTNLQYCERPTGSNARTYYSWQGSVEQGYRLETHVLLQLSSSANQDIVRLGVQLASADPANFFAVGSPAYAKNTRADLESFYASCNADVYNQAVLDQTTTGVFTANCRALYDENGVVYYRILSEVAEVSDACHPLRKTTGFMVTDPDLTRITNSDPSIVNGQNYCEQRGGYWADDLADGQANTPVCQRCANGGQYQNGACVYWTTSEPGGAYSCPAEANGCRKYLGTTGGNIRTNVVEKSFEPVARDANGLLTAGAGWSAVSGGTARVVSEALKVGEHSLLLGTGGNTFRYELDPVAGETLTTVRGWYELSFWARGDANALSVRFVQNGQVVGNFTINPATNLNMPVRVGAEWQSYSLGQAEFIGNSTDPVYLEFIKEAASGPVYIDNVRLAHVPSEIIAVKDSWSTPEVCDSTPTDNVPGEMLGCKAYTSESRSATVAALGFAKLCREEAVGCSPVLDTENTLEGVSPESARAYNVWCAGTAGPSTCALVVGAGSEEASYTCPVLRGEDGCYLSGVIELPDGYTLPADAVTASTVIIPADTPIDEPLFLTVTDEVKCQSESMGCTRVGAEEKQFPTIDTTYTHSDVWIRNQPDKYIGAGGTRGTLCTNEAVSCSRFTSDDGVSYFKDPVVNGRSTCTYRPEVQTANGTIGGWFLDGIGLCSNVGANGTQAYCRSNADCGSGNTCVASTINQQPCYPTYQRLAEDGIYYDLWSNDSVGNYQGLVGNCPVTANSCTEFIDPVDTSSLYPEGQPYYALYNSDLRARSRECNGEVSISEGCVLLNKTDDPDLQFDAAATYDLSERSSPPNSLVSPVSTNANDANVILKVTRDRSCAEWLSCKSSFPVKQPDGTVRNVCYEYKSCTAAEPDSLDKGGRCIDRPESEGVINRLTEEQYVNRGSGPGGIVTWRDHEYSGYSLFNQYQINDVRYINFDLSSYIAENQQNLTPQDIASLQRVQTQSYIVYDRDNARFDCSAVESDWQVCGSPAASGGGRCYSGRCIYPMSGLFPDESVIPRTNITSLFDYLVGGTCKAFPEEDAPFTTAILDNTQGAQLNRIRSPLSNVLSQSRVEFVSKKIGFGSANVCQNGECSCGYVKAEYRNGTEDYWMIGTTLIPPGVCVGGAYDGRPCDVNSSQSCNSVYTSDGYCSPLSRTQTSVGVKGYCLEPDYSRPINGAVDALAGEKQEYACLTWLPIDASASSVDLVNTFVGAGYNPEQDAVVRGADGSIVGSINGQAYCSRATQVGGKVNSTETAFTQTDAAAWDSSIFNSVYLANGDYNPASTPPNLTNTYGLSDTFIYHQTWAWRILGANATMLRISNGCSAWQTVPANQISCSSGIFDNHIVEGPGGVCLRQGGTTGVPMVYMHPPRTWDDTDVPRKLSLLEQSYVELPNQFCSRPQRFYTFPLAPYPEGRDVYSQSTLANDSLGNGYTSIGTSDDRIVTESVLREFDIQRVYFWINVYRSSVLSTTETDGLFIDFQKLRSLPERSEVRTIIDQDEDRPMKIWTYVLERDESSRLPAEGLVSFDRYQGQNDPTKTAVTYYAEQPRNQVTKRYVMVVGYPDVTNASANPPTYAADAPPYIPSSVENDPTVPANTTMDPFSATACTGRWSAIGWDFNAEGEFLGYIRTDCGGVGLDFSSMTVALVDQCTEFVQVYDPTDLTGNTNKAWTNRVWENANEETTHAPLRHPHPDYGGTLFRRDVLNQPFGSLRLRGSDINLSNSSDLLYYSFGNNTRPTTPEDVSPDGVPYACTEASWRRLSILSSTGNVCGPDTSLASVVSGKSAATALAAIHQLFARFYNVVRVEPNAASQLVLTESSMTDSEKDLASNSNLGQVSGANLQPPQIYSLNPVTCAEEEGVIRTCTPGESNNVTVNEKNATLTDYDRDIAGLPDEDKNGFPGVDALIGVGNLTVDLKFFAFADDNRMPLRRVMVDWADESIPTNEGVTGLYKNHKPFCSADDSSSVSVGLCGSDADNLTGVTCKADTDCPFDENGRQTMQCYGLVNVANSRCGFSRTSLTSQSCVTDDDCETVGSGQQRRLFCFADRAGTGRPSQSYTNSRFGNAVRACTNEPFHFRYDYTCSNSDIRDTDNNGSFDRTYVKTVSQVQSADARNQLIERYNLRLDSPVCVFQPRVQALDNWGWCNGQCAGQANGCYNGTREPGTVGFVDQCNRGSYSDNDNPWTNYRGEIIVIPPSR